MERPTNNSVRHIVQRERHCGPAVVEMLYSFYADMCVSQDEVAAATGLSLDTILHSGCSILDLAHAVEALDNGFALLAKYNSTLEDLDHAVNTLKLPVGVEWRCVFREPDGGLWGEGHYSTITGVDLPNNVLHIADPFNGENISHDNGLITPAAFYASWWDENFVMVEADPAVAEHIWTEGLMFVVAPRGMASTLEAPGFRRPTPQLLQASRTTERPIEYPTRPEEARIVQPRKHA